MVSFDVELLFTNIPIEGAVQATLRKLESDPTCSNRGPLGLHVDLRTARLHSHGELGFRGRC